MLLMTCIISDIRCVVPVLHCLHVWGAPRTRMADLSSRGDVHDSKKILHYVECQTVSDVFLLIIAVEIRHGFADG